MNSPTCPICNNLCGMDLSYVTRLFSCKNCTLQLPSYSLDNCNLKKFYGSYYPADEYITFSIRDKINEKVICEIISFSNVYIVQTCSVDNLSKNNTIWTIEKNINPTEGYSLLKEYLPKLQKLLAFI